MRIVNRINTKIPLRGNSNIMEFPSCASCSMQFQFLICDACKTHTLDTVFVNITSVRHEAGRLFQGQFSVYWNHECLQM